MSTEKTESIWNKDFILLLIVNAFVFMSMHMLSTTIAKFSMILNGTEAVAGLVAGVFSVSAILVRPICGNLIDRKKKKKIYLIALLIIMAGMIGYSFSSSNTALVVFRLIHGVGWGFATTTGMTMASNTAPAGKVGECVGVYGLANVLAMALAPNLGVFLSENYGYRVMSAVAASVVLCAIAALFAVKEQAVPEGRGNLKLSPKNIILKEALFPSVVLLLNGMAYTSITTFLIIYAQSVGITRPGLFFTIYSVVILFVRFFSGRVVDRKGPEFIIIPGAFFFTGCLLLLGGLKNSTMLYLAAVFLGLGYSATLSTLMAVSFMRTSMDRRGIASSTINIGMDLGVGLGSTFAGTLIVFFNYSTTYYLLCFPVIAAALLFVIDQISFKNKSGFYREHDTHNLRTTEEASS